MWTWHLGGPPTRSAANLEKSGSSRYGDSTIISPTRLSGKALEFHPSGKVCLK